MQRQLINDLPDWIPQDSWDGWMEMRKQKKIPTTERAKAMAIKVLSALRDQGEEIEHVLGQSEFQGWAGLFKVSDAYYQMLGIDRTKHKEKAKVVSLVDRSWAEN
jgi:hypothetical protein